MQTKPIYPRWFQVFRGFVVGLAFGCSVTALVYEMKFAPAGGSGWKQFLFYPLVIDLVPLIVLAWFEIYFAIRHYRALRRAMDGRAEAA